MAMRLKGVFVKQNFSNFSTTVSLRTAKKGIFNLGGFGKGGAWWWGDVSGGISSEACQEDENQSANFNFLFKSFTFHIFLSCI